MRIPELEHNPLVRRVIATFDTDGSGEVDFKEFVSALGVFASTDSKEDKYKCECLALVIFSFPLISP